MAARKKSKSTELAGQSDPRAPLDSAAFLAEARPVLAKLTDDLLARADASPAVTRALEARHAAEQAAQRTAESFVTWRRSFVDQVAAAWLLSCVFVRTLEDRGLVGQARLAGTGAADSQRLFLELAPSLTERDYLLTVFRELCHVPAARELFDAKHNPVWLLAPSAEAAKALLQLFRAPHADAPAFRFGQADTRFLGDLYQDLNDDVKKRYALLQTPRFVESFILDRTLERAIERFGLDDTKLIDPTCGSGHFLLGAFERLVDHRLRAEPGLDVREAARRALNQVFGADINPYAVAIARFRLTLAFLEKAGYATLTEAPALPLHLVVADSLLHNPHLKQLELGDQPRATVAAWKGEEFALEDEAAARAVLHQQYAAVVGNPPYITVKDAVLRERYRKMYSRSASGKYSVAAPFTERFFQLGREGAAVGMITANSFMKREFGKNLIEEYLPTVNLDLVINTSGAYIPGHGTPTVLLFGTSEAARDSQVHVVLASRGEPRTPEDPEQGLVWRSIADHWREVGFENDHITVALVGRSKLSQHPWPLGGGGASELKALLEERANKRLGDVAEDIGFASFTGLDDAFILPSNAARTLGLEDTVVRPMVVGEHIRDWAVDTDEVAITPYSRETHEAISLDPPARWARFLWRYRTVANNVSSFGGKTREQEGQSWWHWYRWQQERYQAPFRIAFAFVATHNHFVLDRGGKVFKQSAPIIKLPESATEDDHYALLAYLNSSTACFWMKQVIHSKTNHTDDRPEVFEPGTLYYEFTGTALQRCPLPPRSTWRSLAAFGRAAEAIAQAQSLVSPRPVAESIVHGRGDTAPLAMIRDAEDRHRRCRDQLVALQEDLDWFVYALFELATAAEGQQVLSVPLAPEQRLFLAGQPSPTLLAVGGEVWTARKLRFDGSATIRQLENAEQKRRWIGAGRGSFAHEARSYAERCRDEVADIVLSECEAVLGRARAPASPKSIAHDLDRRSSELVAWSSDATADRFLTAACLRGCVPFLAAHRFTDSGLAKHQLWQQTWSLQRREDTGENVGVIPVPPRYDQKDYRDPTYYRLRGKLDVPKERFISYPGCESDEDGEPVYGWAGWDHVQRARALGTLYYKRKTEEGWKTDRLTPMLAGLLELLPWLHQWHAEPDEEYGGESPAKYFQDFLDGQCTELGLTHDDLKAWRPPEKTRAKRSKRTKEPSAEAEDNG